eukprot:gene18329-24020_t
MDTFNYIANNQNYSPIPSEYQLNHVVIIHRHGDRSQISHSLGSKYPENHKVTNFWNRRLLTNKTIQELSSIGILSADIASNEEFSLYSGWDKSSFPYGQLTEFGYNELKSLGQTIRSRYNHLLFNQFIPKQHLLLRSTNSCRTTQSLRSFLSGLFDNISYSDQPIIRVLPKQQETLFPQADGICQKIGNIRSKVVELLKIEDRVDEYRSLEEKLKNILGFDNVPWLTVKEVLTCHLRHGYDLPTNITSVDEAKVSEIAGIISGAVYKNDDLNRLAIGRFLTELIDDLSYVDSSFESKSLDSSDKRYAIGATGPIRMTVYSGHDSSLVPVMCALGLYDDVWPPYASYLSFEIVTNKYSNIKYVRAIYNDDDRNMLGQTETWLLYSTFIDRLKHMSITKDEYTRECSLTNEAVNVPSNVNDDSVVIDESSNEEDKLYDQQLLDAMKEIEHQIHGSVEQTSREVN